MELIWPQLQYWRTSGISSRKGVSKDQIELMGPLDPENIRNENSTVLKQTRDKRQFVTCWMSFLKLFENEALEGEAFLSPSS